MRELHLSFALPWWFALLSIAIAAALALWAYARTRPALEERRRLLLGSLRFLALVALLLALWQPLMSLVSSTEQAPRLAILLDNSASMALRDASGERAPRYRKLLAQLEPVLTAPNALVARFDATVHPLNQWHPDSLRLDGGATDIAYALRWVAAESRTTPIGTVLLLSDGVPTAGGSPLQEVATLGKPIIAVLVGDTTPVADLAVHSLLSNEQLLLGSTAPLYATIRASNMPERSVTVELWENSRRLAQQQLQLRPEQSEYTLRFDYTPEREGLVRLSIRIAPQPEELNTRNNSATRFVEVLRAQRRILLFAGSPSPDLAFLRQELERIPGIAISTFVHKQGEEFYEGVPSEALLRAADAAILLDFPIRSTPEPLLERLAERARQGMPIAWIAGPLLDYGKLRRLEGVLPMTLRLVRQSEQTAQLLPTPFGRSHPLVGSELPAAAWEQQPPLFRMDWSVQPKPEAQVLALSSPGAEPMLLVYDLPPLRSLALLGYGIHRWKLLGFAALPQQSPSPPDVLAHFARNLLQWLLLSPQQRLVRIRPGKPFYTAGEPVEFWATVVDPTGAAVDAATVQLLLSSGQTRQELLLEPLGGGTYRAQVQLPPGYYAFQGTATLQGERLGSDRGTVTVGTHELEYRQLHADAVLLRALAERSGGALLTASTIQELPELLKRLPALRPQVFTQRREIALWHSPWLLSVVIALLSSEWLLRRRWRLP
jgi:hypothetical protein